MTSLDRLPTMEEKWKDGQVKEAVAAHPLSLTTPRRPRRRPSCWRITFVILALLAFAAFVGFAHVSYVGLQGFLHPTRRLAFTTISQPDAIGPQTERPLFGPDDRFDVLATVWLDVTDHLDAGRSLPRSPIDGTPLRVVEYPVSGPFRHKNRGRTRKEAVLFSQILFRQVSARDSKRHATVPLSVPIAPLYTASLGPASLRATFTVQDTLHPPPVNASAHGFRYAGGNTVYTPFPPMLPRIPELLNVDQLYVRSLNHALSRSGISVSLVNLLESRWARPATPSPDNSSIVSAPDARDRTTMMFDAAPDNLHFLRDPALAAAKQNLDRPAMRGRMPEFTDEERTVLLPHIATRSRVALVKDDHVYSQAMAVRVHLRTMQDFTNHCHSWSDARCERPYGLHSFEHSARLIDTRDPDATHQHFYAPFLAHNAMASAARHHRLLPSRAPASAFAEPDAPPLPPPPPPLTLKRSDDDDDQCRVPALDVDATGRFFQFDWDVYFSAHSLRKAVYVEEHAKAIRTLTAHRDKHVLEYGNEGDEQLVAYASPQDDSMWWWMAYMSGDAPHPDARQTRTVVYGVFAAVVLLPAYFLLQIGYWYTRTSTAGIYTDAQWVGVASLALRFGLRATKESSDLDPITAFFGTASSLAELAYVPWLLMTLLRVRKRGSRPTASSLPDWEPDRRRGRRSVWRRWLRLERRPLSRREKESLRVERVQIGNVRLAALAMVLMTLCILSPQLDVTVRERMGCPEHRSSTPSTGIDRLRDGLWNVVWAWSLTAQVGQLVFNQACGRYAGDFRLKAWSDFGSLVVGVAFQQLSLVSGWTDKREAVVVSDLVQLLVYGVAALQAWRFAGVVQGRRGGDGDDDGEGKEKEDEGNDGLRRRQHVQM
ncbi:uncharacterized protein PFL1_06263 [Pseudozyma flocculosa PF-1]|uniref:Uncharacterized protein n=1 Tax=Pseudozyma flocculosa PF-1 TaxID=1277687 RepID=A0A061H1R7_9BASI|nr:uncharacterized protein PFL1_06263 [Pseudozyma flocculosa PF-1]EPQ26054.1 hypothetical protein PFL1_06263 [Pseudozyma flocculosa PF-1]